jgi:hypothetical protein
MMKDALIVGGSAAAGTFISQRWGGALEVQAAKLHIPPTIAHMAVVGSFSALSYFLLKAIL